MGGCLENRDRYPWPQVLNSNGPGALGNFQSAASGIVDGLSSQPWLAPVVGVAGLIGVTVILVSRVNNKKVADRLDWNVFPPSLLPEAHLDSIFAGISLCYFIAWKIKLTFMLKVQSRTEQWVLAFEHIHRASSALAPWVPRYGLGLMSTTAGMPFPKINTFAELEEGSGMCSVVRLNPKQIRDEVLATPLDYVRVGARAAFIFGSLGWYGASLLMDRIFSRDAQGCIHVH